jgi:hypothetical protein
MSSIGNASRPANVEDSSDDDYGPALPPSLVAARAQASTSRPEPEPQVRPVIGPTLPSTRHQEEEDDDVDIGPTPLPTTAAQQEERDGVKAFLEAEERRKKGLQVNLNLYYTCSNVLLMTFRVNLDHSPLKEKNGCLPLPLHLIYLFVCENHSSVFISQCNRSCSFGPQEAEDDQESVLCSNFHV